MPKAQKSDPRVTIRFPKRDHYAAVVAAAEEESMSVSTFVRHAAVKAARPSTKPGAASQ